MKWISVKDQLPNKYERVLVTNGKEVCLHAKQSAFTFEGAEGEDLYSVAGFCYEMGKSRCTIFEDVTHWMNLPEVPPKDEE